jgi:transposase
MGYLRGHANILKRVLVHLGAFNLGLLMRRLIGVGTPRGLQGRAAGCGVWLVALCRVITDSVLTRLSWVELTHVTIPPRLSRFGRQFETRTCTPGC